MPESGVDYPRNWNEFMDWFSDEQKCYQYLEKLKWKNGFICPSCQVLAEPYRTTRGRLTCRSCFHQTTVTAGTIFHKTRTPLRTWFSAIWYVLIGIWNEVASCQICSNADITWFISSFKTIV